MTLFSAFASSQELKVSNQRTAVAEHNQKGAPLSGEHTAGTLVVRSVERTMNAVNTEQSGQEPREANGVPESAPIVVSSMERNTNSAVPAYSNQPKVNTTGKPE